MIPHQIKLSEDFNDYTESRISCNYRFNCILGQNVRLELTNARENFIDLATDESSSCEINQLQCNEPTGNGLLKNKYCSTENIIDNNLTVNQTVSWNDREMQIGMNSLSK